jgi:hypothetical protein
MKKLRKILKLMPPAFMMRLWLKRSYGIIVPPAPGNVITKFFLALLPYAFTAALSVRVESDCRLVKYFLPYGKMKKFVRLMYNLHVGDDEKDCGMAGKFRAVMPYGIVLWWDADDIRIAQNVIKQTSKAKAKVSQTQFKQESELSFGWRMPEQERVFFLRTDKIEAMTLRALIIQG